MDETKLVEVDKLIDSQNIDQAQIELSKLGPEFYKNAQYLFLRSKIFYVNKLYYIAIDTLLIALEFEKKDEIYNLLSQIYKTLGNEQLSIKISDSNVRAEAVKSIKDQLTGIYKIK